LLEGCRSGDEVTETDSAEYLDKLFEGVFDSPELYLWSIDLADSVMLFTPMSAETYKSTPFLDERIERVLPVDGRVEMQAFFESFEQAGPEQLPLSFVFHTAYCCSTLLARCIAEMDHTLVLKEPVPLQILSESWFANPQGHDLHRVTNVVGTLLSRRFASETVVVKATSYCNGLMADLLDLHEENRAVFLFSSLEESLASFLKDPERRGQARSYLAIMGGLLPSDLPESNPYAMIDAQIVALLWMVQVHHFCELARKRFGGRLLALNSNEFLANPGHALQRTASHFGITVSENHLRTILASTAFRTASKYQDRDFSRQDRRSDLERSASAYAKEIEFALEWAASVPLWSEIPEILPNEVRAT